MHSNIQVLTTKSPKSTFFLFKKIPIHSSGAIKRNSKTLILASDANSVFTLNCTFCYIEFSLFLISQPTVRTASAREINRTCP